MWGIEWSDGTLTDIQGDKASLDTRVAAERSGTVVEVLGLSGEKPYRYNATAKSAEHNATKKSDLDREAKKVELYRCQAELDAMKKHPGIFSTADTNAMQAIMDALVAELGG